MALKENNSSSEVLRRLQEVDAWWTPYEIEGERVPLLKDWYGAWHPWRQQVDAPVIDAATSQLSEKSLLDIACNDGWYSFEAAKCGFDVTGVEIRNEVVERANLLKNYFQVENVNFIQGDVQDEGVINGSFDVTLFYGILYHLRDPIGALERVGSVTNRIACVQTFIHALDQGARLHLVREDPLEEKNSITRLITTPTQRAVVMMLREAGFDHVYRALPKNYLAGKVNSNASWQWAFFYGVKGDPLPPLEGLYELRDTDRPLNSFGSIRKLIGRAETVARRLSGRDAGSEAFSKKNQ